MITLRVREFDFDPWTELLIEGASEDEVSSIIRSWASRLDWEVEVQVDDEWLRGDENVA